MLGDDVSNFQKISEDIGSIPLFIFNLNAELPVSGTLLQCKQRCVTKHRCRSFEYVNHINPLLGLCTLKFVNPLDPGVILEESHQLNTDIYIRTCVPTPP